jgi:hypothetical protein
MTGSAFAVKAIANELLATTEYRVTAEGIGR